MRQATLLGGRVAYRQPPHGHRSGIEPVFLAAAVAARAGDRVLEAGCGAGAGLLCLAARVPGIAGLGIERDPALAELAAANAAANGFAGLAFRAADIAAPPGQAGFDHAMANPPWFHEAATASPDAARDLARRGRQGMVSAWIGAMAAALRPGGSLTLVLPPARLPEALAALEARGLGAIAVLPLWPRAGTEAKILLMRAVLRRRTACRMLPGLVLHEADGRFTAVAQAVLRDGQPIGWG